MDVPVCNEAVTDDEVILFTELNDSFCIVCEVTYSILSHDSFSVLVIVFCPCVKVSMQDVMLWNIINCHQQ